MPGNEPYESNEAHASRIAMREERGLSIHDEDRGIGEIVQDLADGTRALVSQEIELAKLEVQIAVQRAKEGGVLAGAAVGPLLLGGIALTFALIYALALVLPLWAAALIVGVVMVVIGGALAAAGIAKLKKTSFKLEQTRESLKEGREWIGRRLT